MATLYIHIGTPKTGTTSIQNFLELNQETLKKYGICLPYMDLDFERSKFKLHRNGNFLVHHAFELSDNPTEKLKKEERIYIQGFDIIKKAAETYPKIIITDESIWYRQNNKENFWQDVRDNARARGCDVKVIVYVRRQDLYIEAWWNQAVKYYPRSFKTFEEYIKSDVVLFHNLDYYKKINEIADCIGRENVVVKVFEKEIFLASQFGLYQDFLDSLGEEVRPDYVMPTENINDSLRGNFVEIKRLINEVPEYRQGPDFLKRQVIKASSMVSQDKVSYFAYEDKLEFLKKYEESNRKLAEEFLGKKDGILFHEPVKKLKKWEVDEQIIYRDMIYLFTQVITDQQKQMDRMGKRIAELEKESHDPFSHTKVILKRLTKSIKKFVKRIKKYAKRLKNKFYTNQKEV